MVQDKQPAHAGKQLLKGNAAWPRCSQSISIPEQRLARLEKNERYVLEGV